MRYQRLFLSAFGCLLLLGPCRPLIAQGPPNFPVPRASGEFNSLVRSSSAYWKSLAGNEDAFRQSAVPYGPLDLQVENGTPEEVEALRNFNLGVSSFFAQLPRGRAAEMANEFHCGPPCTSSRKNTLKRQLEKIKHVVKRFENLPELRILSQWGKPEEFRMNNIFVISGETRESMPSSEMGFVPSGTWRQLESVEDYIKRIAVSPAELKAMLQTLHDLGLAALVKKKSGEIFVVQTGISDNESGLLLLPDKGKKPGLKQKTSNGGEYSYVDELEPNIFYYETT